VEAVEVCLGSSTVLAVVVIVIKHRACLSVGQLIVSVQARSFISFIGYRRLGRT
jgi:hypothetical protein